MYKITLKCILVLSIFFISIKSFAQLGVSFHQSNLPFVGISYEINNKFLPELRIGADNYIEDTSLEFAVNYIFKRNEIVNIYAGVGGRIGSLEGIVVPVGLNIYPFEKKNFGFQIELAPILRESSVLRGSGGIRYRF
ncbi:hypothetical protein APR41_03045 [Salegentibacter salinarum]|uniref:Outer membrane insertion C-signal n=1 Tax=Salegentibacter salinarum TaxID=447422 RepID=A0A2N0TXX5_9FLAO|nr:hypothetical protein [Salegentibacter salinarum]PKD19597.1 hypothetical protein APR41_03045 [Salegentibacter salinarum]SKB42226.1 hypothetical protein SAMN05660903_00622 [Salegentibacter salinarum]